MHGRTYRRYQINEKFFDEWSAEMAYVLGVIFADGTICRTHLRGRMVENKFSISSKNEHHLGLINGLMGSAHRIEPQSNQNGSWFRSVYGSKLMTDKLQSFGVVHRKSNRMLLPEIPKQCVTHFVRGYFDGDGSVFPNKHKKTPHIEASFTSESFKFLVTLSKILSMLGITPQGPYNYDRWTPFVRYQRGEAVKLINLIYDQSSEGLRFDVKFNRAIELLRKSPLIDSKTRMYLPQHNATANRGQRGASRISDYLWKFMQPERLNMASGLDNPHAIVRTSGNK